MQMTNIKTLKTLLNRQRINHTIYFNAFEFNGGAVLCSTWRKPGATEHCATIISAETVPPSSPKVSAEAFGLKPIAEEKIPQHSLIYFDVL